MSETLLSYRIFINGYKLIKKITLSDKKIYYLLDNNKEIKRKDIYSIYVLCDNCDYKKELKNLPENYILENKTYLCKSCRNKGINNPMFGKKWSDERKKEISEKYKGSGNPMFGRTIYEVWLGKYEEDHVHYKWISYLKKQKESNSGENNPMFGRNYFDIWVDKYGELEANKKQKNKKEKHREWLKNNPNQLLKMISKSHERNYRKTNIEKKVEKYLIDNKIDYKYNFIINRYQFDFLIKERNIIIEVQGDYWHANPTTYSDFDINKKKLNIRQKYKVEMDLKKKEFIENKYDIIYLWETDINNNNYEKILKKWNL